MATQTTGFGAVSAGLFGLAAMLAASAQAGPAESQKAIEVLTMQRCLPSIVARQPVVTERLIEVPTDQATGLIGAHEGAVWMTEEPSVVMNAADENLCLVIGNNVDVGWVQAFGATWFGTDKTPFALNKAEGDPNGSMTAEYHGQGAVFGGVRVLVSTQSDSGIAMVTLFRAP